MAAPTITDTATLSWSAIVTESYNAGSGTRLTGRIYIAQAPGTPASMTVTATTTNGEHTGISVCQVTGAKLSITNFAGAQAGTGGNPTVTLPQAPTSGLIIAAFVVCEGGVVPKPTVLDTEFSDLGSIGGGLDSSYVMTLPRHPLVGRGRWQPRLQVSVLE